MTGFISKGLLWNLHHDYFYAYVVMSKLFSVHGAITGKFIAAEHALNVHGKNPFDWQGYAINTHSMADVTMQHAKLATEGGLKIK